MPIPDFNGEGLLPEGVHECTLDEVRERFGRFKRSDRRAELVKKLCSYCDDLRHVPLAYYLVVDGSFVTDKEEPNDVDILLVLRADADLSADFAPLEYNAISKRRVARKYAFDLLVAQDGSEAHQRQLAYFTQ